MQSEGIREQLADTTAELRELMLRQQQLEARNVLLEKVAELNTAQQSKDVQKLMQLLALSACC